MLLLAWVAGGTAAAAQAAPPVSLHAAEDRVPIAGHIEVLHDQAGTMTWREAAAAGEAGRFRPIPADFNAGYAREGAWWLRFALAPADGAGGAWWLSIWAPYTDQIDVYGPVTAGATTAAAPHRPAGVVLPLDQRALALPLPAVPLELEAGATQMVYLRLESSRSIGARPILWRLPALLHRVVVDNLVLAALIGAGLAAAVGTFIVGIWLRDARFIWYGAYVGTTAMVFAQNNGYAPILFEGLSPAAMLRIQGVIGSLSIMSGVFLLLVVFPVPRRLRVLGWVITGFGGFAAATAVVSTVGYYGVAAPYLMLGIIFVSAATPVLGSWHVAQRTPGALWSLIGFICYCAALLWFAASALALVPLSDFGTSGPQLLAAVHMVVIFCVLAAALRAGERERRRLQGDLLAASQRNERALGAAVAQRTAALAAEVEARRLAEAHLLVALREQRHFLVVVGHEFRTPLAAIRTASATIERAAAGLHADVAHEADKIGRMVRRLAGLIETFLGEASLGRSVDELRREPLDVDALVRELCEDHAQQSGRRFRVEGRLPAISADPPLLRAALDNLLSNAVKYSGGDVTVLLGERDAGVSISVADEGAGIPVDEQAQIFERYFRGAAALSQPGAGVGLNIVRSAVELHGGTVAVRSAVGVGTAFEIWLPVESAGPK